MKTPENREIELKFSIGADDLAKVEALPAFELPLAEAERSRLDSIYFDTPDRDLWKRGFSLRTRRIGDRFIEAIKQETSSLIARGEWECETPSASPSLARADETPLAAVIGKPRIRAALRPAFEVDMDRRSFAVHADGALIEGVIDTGRIDAEGATLPVRELELELKEGAPSALFDLARAVVARAPLCPSFISKAERGYLLASGSWGRSAKGSKPRLSADMSCREAFQAIVRTCLHDLMLNTLAFETDDAVEGVHQARIAIRRLRAALTLFKPMIRDAAFDTLSGELKWLGGLLGTARDLDVMQLERPTRTTHIVGDAEDLAGEIEARRKAAHEAVRQGFASQRCRAFLVDLVAWTEQGPWQEQCADLARSRVVDTVPRRLRKRRKALIAAGADLATLDPAARHRIRIAAKKLRYMAEFFADVAEVAARRKAYRKLIRSLEDLQQALGEMHDIEVEEAFLAGELVSTPGGGQRGEAAAGYLLSARADTTKQLAKALDAYADLVAADPF